MTGAVTGADSFRGRDQDEDYQAESPAPSNQVCQASQLPSVRGIFCKRHATQHVFSSADQCMPTPGCQLRTCLKRLMRRVGSWFDLCYLPVRVLAASSCPTCRDPRTAGLATLFQ